MNANQDPKMIQNSDAVHGSRLYSDCKIDMWDLVPLNPPQAPTCKGKLSQTLEVPSFTVVKLENTRSSSDNKNLNKLESLVADKFKPKPTRTAPRTPKFRPAKLIPVRALRLYRSDSNR